MLPDNIMQKLLKLFLITYLIFSNYQAAAEISSTYSINSKTSKKLLEWVDAETIIFIEIDNVLLMPKAKMFSYDTNPYRLFISNLMSYSKQTPGYKKAVARWYAQREVKLVESAWLDFIKQAKEKGAKLYGVCTMPLYLTNIEAKRLSELQALGVNFDPEINGQNLLTLQENTHWPARFDQGLIFTASLPKSQALLALIKKTNLSPEKILSFFYIKHEVKAIDKMLRRFNLSFKTIAYLGARNVKGKPDDQLVQFQQKQLIQNGKWYEDEEAARLLKSAK